MTIIVDDLSFTILAAARGADGRFYFSNRSGVFEIVGGVPVHIWTPPCDVGKFNIHRMHADPWGGLYFACRNGGILYRRARGDKDFHPVYKLDGVTRGFDYHAPSGLLFLGKYGQKGPAQILSSSDGETWSVHYEWDAKHIHDLRVNPHNDMLYVVVGEGEKKRTFDSHALYTSSDMVKFRKVFEANGTRPLILPINFRGATVIAGTDHFEGGNYIFLLEEDGGGSLLPQKAFVLPHQDGGEKPKPYPYFMEWCGQTLLIGVRGKDVSFLLGTQDLQQFEILSESRKRATDYTVSTVGGADRLLVSGLPGKIVRSGKSSQ